MLTVEFVRRMARYNAWQNESVLIAAERLDDATRAADRGAHFGSIAGTLNHLLWGDAMWMHRFSGSPQPATPLAASAAYCETWAAFRSARVAMDRAISAWAEGLEQSALDGTLTWWSGAANAEISRPMGEPVLHFFNHQTHHRGQVHAMLTAAGAEGYVSDLFLQPD